jgi:hypothetical protein
MTIVQMGRNVTQDAVEKVGEGNMKSCAAIYEMIGIEATLSVRFACFQEFYAVAYVIR